MTIIYLQCLLSMVILTQEGLVITEKDSIKGDIKVYLEKNQVVVRKGNNYELLFANRVKEVIAYEDGAKIKYYSAEYGIEGKRQLFKVISEGNATLVYRSGIGKSAVDDAVFPDFHIYEEGQITQSLDTEKDYIKVMKDQKEAIKSYLSTNIFFADDEVMIKELFDYYNSL